MWKAISTTLTLLAATAVTANPEDHPYWAQTEAAGSGHLIAFVGDSYLHGAVNDPYITANRPVNARLACWARLCMAGMAIDHLNSLLPGQLTIVNRAFGGTTSRDWSPLLPVRYDDLSVVVNGESLYFTIPAADTVVIQLGVNDTLAPWEAEGRLKLTEYKEHVTALVESLTRRGVENVVLLGQMVPKGWDGNEHDVRLEKYRTWLEEYVASRNFFQEQGVGGYLGNVFYVDTDAKDPAHWQDDDVIHPNIAGSHHAAQLIAEVLYTEVLGLGPMPEPVPYPEL